MTLTTATGANRLSNSTADHLVKNGKFSAVSKRVFAKQSPLDIRPARASFALSVFLWFSGSKDEGVFVGIWVPSILSFGTLILGGKSNG